MQHEYCLTFLEIPHLKITEKTRDLIFTKAQNILDDYLYQQLKHGQKIPLAHSKTATEHTIAPSEPIQEALRFYLET